MNGWTLWFTGLPASGKSTLARALREQLQGCGIPSVLLDSDEVRPLLIPHPTYSEAERDEFYHTLVQIAGVLNGFALNVLIAATAPRRLYREWARETLPRFGEIWVRAPLTLCQARDPKQLYARAATGAIATLPGIGTPYEAPLVPELIIESDHTPIPQAIALIQQRFPEWLTPPIPSPVRAKEG